jgi:hypothetical protein
MSEVCEHEGKYHKQGFVYVANRDGCDELKVGLSSNPEWRIKYYSPGSKARLLWFAEVHCMRCAELGAHYTLRDKRIGAAGTEWFSASLIECMEAIAYAVVKQTEVAAFRQGFDYCKNTAGPVGHLVPHAGLLRHVAGVADQA